MGEISSLKQARRRVLEVIVTSAEEARIAADAGADRLELIRDFAIGGLTPDLRVVEKTLSSVTIPVRVMVRETESFELRDKTARNNMKELASAISSLGVNGLVLGFVYNNEVDEDALTEVLSLIKDTKITFHRAFESTKNPGQSIAALKLFPEIDRVLTNGGGRKIDIVRKSSVADAWGNGDWNERIQRLEELQKTSGMIKFLVGGEVDEQALSMLSNSSLDEFHVGRSVRTPETVYGAIDEIKIGKMQKILHSH